MNPTISCKWRWLALAVMFGVSTAPLAWADLLGDPNEDFNLFGKQMNACINGGGICAAASAINSFIFLENRYPQIYGGTLTPAVVGVAPNQTDPTDLFAFAILYYFFPGGDPQTTYLDQLEFWIDTAAPGSTVFDSYYIGSADNDRTPLASDLISEIGDQEDVTLFVRDNDKPDVAHAVVLNGISCTALDGCVMKYQDPNSPGVLQTSQLTAGPGGLEFVVCREPGLHT